MSKTIKNEAKKQKVEFLGVLLGTLGAASWGHMLAGNGARPTSWGWGVNNTWNNTWIFLIIW